MKKSSVKKYAKTKHDDLPTKKESVNEKVNKSDLKYQLDMSLDNLGIGTKALIVMKPKGKDFFLKMKSYMYQDSMEAVLKDANKNLKPGQLPVRVLEISFDKPDNVIKNKSALDNEFFLYRPKL